MTTSAAATVPPRIWGERHLLAMILFIASESIFFLAVIAAYVVYRSEGLALAKQHLELGRTALFSLLLFSSSATMTIAVRRRDRRWLGLTAFLGTVFLAGQGAEYARLLDAGIRPGVTLFGTTFFSLTGLHGLHVLIGLALLGGLFVAASAKGRRVGPVAWETIALYWHFVDAVWVVVFSLVYLGSVL
ncbi:MAG: heme-copper oxidase subunit III [Candidatus Limnocylindrales bacterium]